MSAAFGNVTYLGLPVINEMLGQQFGYAAILYELLANTPVLLTLGVFIAARFGTGKSVSLAHSVKRVLTLPPLWGVALGIAVNLGGVPVPQAVLLSEPVLGEARDQGALLLALLDRPNLCAREWIIPQQDHEVQGASVVKPLVGRGVPVPGDAAVLRPRLDSQKGLALALALNPAYSEIDAYHMAAVTIDEAVRRLVAVGGSLDHVGGVDNFCWPSVEYDARGNPDGKYKAAQLVRACWALRDLCRAYEIPLLSGKDSMYVDGVLPGAFGETHRVSAPPTLFFTAASLLPDLCRVVTFDLKSPGDLLYLVGETRPELGGSEFYEMLAYVGLSVPQVRPEEFLARYRIVEQAIEQGLLASCRTLTRGGLAVHLALTAMAGGLGVEVDLGSVAEGLAAHVALYSESAGRFLVSVAAENRGRFEALFQGQPLLLLGQVRPDKIFSIKLAGNTLMEIRLQDLTAAWTRRFGSCFPTPLRSPRRHSTNGHYQ